MYQITSASPQKEYGVYSTQEEALEEAIECLKDGYIVELIEE
jgi:cell division protein FtsB